MSKLAKRLALSAGTLLVLFLALELATRVYTYATHRGFLDNPDSFRSPFITMMWEPDPLIAGARLRFKDQWVPRAKPRDELRVLFLGGSTTENVKAGVRFTDVVQDRLRPAFAPLTVRCLNAGTAGYSTAHSLVNFSLRAIEADPDLVVLMNAYNDMTVSEFGGEVIPDYGNKYKQNFYLGYRHRTGLLNELFKVSRFARHVAYRIDAIHYPKTRGQRGTTARWSETLRLFERNLRSLAGVASAQGIRMVLMTEPGRRVLRDSATYSAFNGKIRALSAELSIPLIDLARDVTAEDAFVDDLHFSRAGTFAASDAILPILSTELRAVARRRLVGEVPRSPGPQPSDAVPGDAPPAR